jgi:hypothetical protein
MYLNNNEDRNFLKKVFAWWSAQIYEDNNTFFLWLSAILIENMPIWAEFSSTPSNRISLMSEWEAKIAAIETKRENVTSFAGVPLGCLSWWIRCLRIAAEGIYLKLAQSRSLLSRWRKFWTLPRTVQKKILPQRDLSTMKYTMPPKVFLLSGPQ